MKTVCLRVRFVRVCRVLARPALSRSMEREIAEGWTAVLLPLLMLMVVVGRRNAMRESRDRCWDGLMLQ